MGTHLRRFELERQVLTAINARFPSGEGLQGLSEGAVRTWLTTKDGISTMAIAKTVALVRTVGKMVRSAFDESGHSIVGRVSIGPSDVELLLSEWSAEIANE